MDTATKEFYELCFNPQAVTREEYNAVKKLIDKPDNLIKLDKRFENTSRKLLFWDDDVRHFQVLDYDLKPKYTVFYKHSPYDYKLYIENE